MISKSFMILTFTGIEDDLKIINFLLRRDHGMIDVDFHSIRISWEHIFDVERLFVSWY